jgi:hypothetical protein
MPFGCGHLLSYDVALTTGLDEGFSSASGVRGARQSWKSDNNENKQVWGRVAASFTTRWFDALEVGVSGTYGRYDDADDFSVSGFAVDGLLRRGPFEVRGEYIRYDLDRPTSAPITAPRRMDGVWVEGAYHFFPSLFCRDCPPFVTDTSLFTLAARYQRTDLNHRLRGGSFQDDAQSVGVGLNYRVTEQMVFRVDHTWIFAEDDPDQREITFSWSTYF